MKITATILVFGLVVLIFLGIRSIQSSDQVQIRRYEISNVLLSGGENAQQQRLYDFYRAALESGRDNLIRRTFEGAGIEFSEGTTAILNPADTHLYIKHRVSVLDTIEREFSIHGVAYQPPSLVRKLIEDMLERIGIGNSDPFAEPQPKPGQNKPS